MNRTPKSTPQQRKIKAESEVRWLTGQINDQAEHLSRLRKTRQRWQRMLDCADKAIEKEKFNL